MIGRSSLQLGLAFGVLTATLAPFAFGTGCKSSQDIHDTDEAKSKPCIACHDSAYRAAQNPVHVNALPQTCQDCHSTQAWSPVAVTAQNHKWFPLQNKHATPTCTSCHTKSFKPGDTPTDCKGCHQKNYDTAQSPVHTGYPTDCKVCHNDFGWKPSNFVHPWALLNLHAQIPCASCHTGSPPKWVVPTDCNGCHQSQYDAAQNPIHRPVGSTTGMVLQGGRTCGECHTTGGGTTAGGWRPSTFVHPTTPFTLTGAHTTVKCNDCHAAPLPTGTAPRGYASAAMPTNCVDCHIADYNASPFAGHQTFSKTCTDCHTTAPTWKPALKGAPAAAGVHPEANFPLRTPSLHTQIRCLDCHDLTRGAVATAGANADCVTCHGLQGTSWKPVHALGPLDVRHTAKGVTLTPGQPANFCLSCHPAGKK
jgi:hypothetical protein